MSVFLVLFSLLICVFDNQVSEFRLEFIVGEVERVKGGYELLKVGISLIFGVPEDEGKLNHAGDEEILCCWVVIVSRVQNIKLKLLFGSSVTTRILGGLILDDNACKLLFAFLTEHRIILHGYFINHGYGVSAAKLACVGVGVVKFLLGEKLVLVSHKAEGFYVVGIKGNARLNVLCHGDKAAADVGNEGTLCLLNAVDVAVRAIAFEG